MKKSFMSSGPGCFTLNVYMLARGCVCSVSLPYGTVGFFCCL